MHLNMLTLSKFIVIQSHVWVVKIAKLHKVPCTAAKTMNIEHYKFWIKETLGSYTYNKQMAILISPQDF